MSADFYRGFQMAAELYAQGGANANATQELLAGPPPAGAGQHQGIMAGGCMPPGGYIPNICNGEQMMQQMMQMMQRLMMQMMMCMMQQMMQQMQGAQGAGAGAGAPQPEPQPLPELEGNVKGKWFAEHGGYEKQEDGSYKITKGEYKDFTLKHCGEGKFDVFNAQGEACGTWQSPANKDKIASPLTFDLNGDGVSTTSVADGKQFDINGDGKVDQTAWAAKGDGVLAFDADGDGKVGEDGKELFGNNTDIDGDGKADGHANGFDALSALAEKHLGAEATADGKLDAAELAELSDKTGLGMMVDGELKGLDELGITEISLGYQEAGTNADANGNEHRQVGEGFTMNGEERDVNDVWFKYE